MRGEHHLSLEVCPAQQGSSPHARGALRRLASGRRLAGIIPACAGSTAPRWRSWPSSRDHPRMRGEHAMGHGPIFSPPGSSPHARGARFPPQRCLAVRRIIPACAGSTRYQRRRKPPPWDHPRMRGEHSIPAAAKTSAMGSSPHARGAPARDLKHARRSGIIPACAGSTTGSPAARERRWDHPRMRGEHTLCRPCGWLRLGSSPHARGAPHESRTDCKRARIIPACAGSTHAPTNARSARRDHPRMRGEHSRNESPGQFAPGSSPHARGAPPQGRLLHDATGIIPACAGSTSAGRRLIKVLRDHPRMRGEHKSFGQSRGSVVGSSPHARGAQCLQRSNRRL